MDEWQATFTSKLNRLATNAEFDEASRMYVLDYIKQKQADGVTAHRLLRVLDFLWHLLSYCKYDISAVSEDRVNDIAIWINNNEDWKGWTKYTYLGILKGFLTWLDEKHKFSFPIRIKRKPPKNSLMPEYLITPEEMNKLLNATDDMQTRLLLGVLYESGARIGEILSLKLQNITFNTYGARLALKGKTGQRMVPIIWYSNLLRQFIESHPVKGNPEAPLWHYFEGKAIKQLNYDLVRMRLSRLCKQAGINKRIHPHLLRHTRLTELATNLSEQTLKALAGWTGDSRMARTYIHLSNKDVEDSLLSKVYGIKIEHESGEANLKVCAKCSEANPHFAKLCQRCKTPLNEKELQHALLNEDKVKEIEDWSQVFLVFLKEMGKKHPDVWSDMKVALKGKEKLLDGLIEQGKP